GNGLAGRLCGDRGRDGSGIHGESGGRTRSCARGVGDNGTEGGAAVGGGRRGSGVRRGSCANNVYRILLPLISEGCRSCGGHGERGRLTGSNGLAGGLRSDRRRCRAGIGYCDVYGGAGGSVSGRVASDGSQNMRAIREGSRVESVVV